MLSAENSISNTAIAKIKMNYGFVFYKFTRGINQGIIQFQNYHSIWSYILLIFPRIEFSQGYVLDKQLSCSLC